MGFGGSVSAMITSMKNNDRRKKRTQFDKNCAGGYGECEKLEFNLPKATPQMLKELRIRLIKERQQLFLKRLVVFSMVIIAIVFAITLI